MAALTATLKREIDSISRFISLLRIEQQVLASGKPNDLAGINAEKIQLVDQLNQLGSERINLINESRPGKDLLAMEAWLALYPAEKQSAALWSSLLVLAREAKELHDLNTQLVGIHLQQTNNALAILTTREPANPLYGSNGQSSALTGSRIVDSA